MAVIFREVSITKLNPTLNCTFTTRPSGIERDWSEIGLTNKRIMNYFLNLIEKGYKHIKSDLSGIDVIVSIKNNLMGINLGSEFLILNDKEIYSFRQKLENIVSQKGLIFLKYYGLIDKEFLTNYFLKNGDNPFALKYIMNMSNSGHDLNDKP